MENVDLHIKTTLYSTDNERSVDFDSAHYFFSLSDEELIEFASSGFFGKSAWGLAALAAERDESIDGVFRYISDLDAAASMSGGDSVAYDCCIDVEDALRWIEHHRPQVFLRIVSNSDIAVECDLSDEDAALAYRRVSTRLESESLKKRVASSPDCGSVGL